jgi:hypothetical protein
MRLNQSAFVQPHCLSPGVATGHIPFGAWLIEALKPRALVDVGTFHGESYLAYCQTVSECNLRTRCFAVGPWRVADRPIEFQDDVFNSLERQNAAYASFSRLVRAGYATAARQFEDGSIDLLQLPTEVEFETLEELMALWQPKLSADAVVLIPDIDATQPRLVRLEAQHIDADGAEAYLKERGYVTIRFDSGVAEILAVRMLPVLREGIRCARDSRQLHARPHLHSRYMVPICYLPSLYHRHHMNHKSPHPNHHIRRILYFLHHNSLHSGFHLFPHNCHMSLYVYFRCYKKERQTQCYPTFCQPNQMILFSRMSGNKMLI